MTALTRPNGETILLDFGDLLHAVQGLPDAEFDRLVTEAKASRERIAAPSEADLLARINEGFPAEWWVRYDALCSKRRGESLTEAEYQELIERTDAIEIAQARRMEGLAGLANLRGTTLPALAAQMGLMPSPHE